MDPRTNPYAPGAGTLPPEVENKIKLLEISWGYRHGIDDGMSWSDGASGTRPEIWRGEPFGARPAPAAVEGKELAKP